MLERQPTVSLFEANWYVAGPYVYKTVHRAQKNRNKALGCDNKFESTSMRKLHIVEKTV